MFIGKLPLLSLCPLISQPATPLAKLADSEK